LYLTLFPSFAHGYWNSGGGSIAIVHNIIKNPLIGEAQFFLDKVTDPEICLMRNKQVQVFCFFSIVIQNCTDNCLEFLYGMFEYGAPVHFHVEASTVDQCFRKPFLAATAGIPDIKFLCIVPIGM